MPPPLEHSYLTSFPELNRPTTIDAGPQPRLLELNEPLAEQLGLDSAWLRTDEGLAWMLGQHTPTADEGREDAPTSDGPALGAPTSGAHASAAPTSDAPVSATPAGATPADPDAATAAMPADLAAPTSEAPEGAPRPVAMAYAGHQFGQVRPVLGDGRAALLGELRAPDGTLYDLHLKGSGRTPFSREGHDGKLPLVAALRELIMGESMHALGIPTTRTLAVIGTGERITRRDPQPEPAAIQVRVAASHLRFGTMQYVAWTHGADLTEKLVDYTTARHRDMWDGTNESSSEESPMTRGLRLVMSVAEAHARLVAQWTLIGFVHGVMNTDNMTLSGEAIDFGPCAFMDTYRHNSSFSSIDEHGRYSFSNQPVIAAWNLARLAEALLPLAGDDATRSQKATEAATEVVKAVPGRVRTLVLEGMAAKLGFPEGASAPGDLVDDLMARMEDAELDYTGTFRRLTDAAPTLREDAIPTDLMRDLGAWVIQWLRAVGGTPDQARMESANPRVVVRHEHLEQTLRWAKVGDHSSFRQMLAAARQPFAPAEKWESAPEGTSSDFVTYCGT